MKLAGVEFSHPIFNAAGPNDETLEQLHIIGKSNSSAVMMKTCTLEPREGNPKPRYYEDELGSINSSGLPNAGYKEYGKYAPILKAAYNKPVIASMIGMKPDDNLKIIKFLSSIQEIDIIELNLSCPNIVGKPQIGYDMEASDKLIGQVKEVCTKPLGLKLPPYFDLVHFENIAKIINKHKPDFVTCINSLGNGLIIDPKTEKAVIKPKGGFGGVGGAYCKPTALANVRKFYELLDKKIQIVGVGGISKGTDAFEFILAGASAVQIGTQFVKEGADVFNRVLIEFEDYYRKKGYKNIEDFKGKLK
ncbi:dihydroorotate oxidase [Nanoarchaeota archaeon]